MSQSVNALFSHGNLEMIDYTSNADVAAGTFVFFGSGLERFIGVTLAGLVANRLGALAIAGIFRVKKKSGVAMAIGDKVGWDVGLSQAVAPSDGTLDVQLGTVVGTAATTDDIVLVKINSARGWESSA